ncbi:quinoprotein glucose dehydrogenase [Paenibacillus sp. FSL H8-0548]|uniref:PQQ-dependent sugar dehydrogenase n=1 Tax=Paenibacillus sp. FSL H8-0548 TaxID=1920422 RepID=UPI00096F05FA|nr:PQQ-dependent sugar dehydrogenase [Paenibacillus sp. FSL H8-0548]OMF20377.1 quinoprotein glucose dehydrogenase [Paenibacillus sp. FSL H8-0548]
MKAGKRLAVILMTTLCVTILAACESNKASETPTSTNEAANKPQETPIDEENKVSEEPGSTDAAYTVLAEKLRIPWVIAFDHDIVYISEREGNIVKVDDDRMTRQAVQLQKGVHELGEGGFLGFVLAPDFEQTKLAYAYHTYEEKGKILNRVVLIKQDGELWNEVRPLLEGIPGAANHDGGRMAIGPDQMLYVTTGDAQQRELAQDKDSLAGKILRMKLDGKVPEDNPFPDSYVYSYGHRNPQGLVWNHEGVMFNTEHGPSGTPGGHDEINIIEAGGNYGWPAIYGGAAQAGMITPIYHSGEQAIAPSGATVDKSNRMLIATLMGGAIYRYDPETKDMSILFEGEGRLRDVSIKDGRIYVITNNTDGRGSPSQDDDRLLLLKVSE